MCNSADKRHKLPRASGMEQVDCGEMFDRRSRRGSAGQAHRKVAARECTAARRARAPCDEERISVVHYMHCHKGHMSRLRANVEKGSPVPFRREHLADCLMG